MQHWIVDHSRQHVQALIISATFYDTASRIACSSCALPKADVAADAFSSPPRMRALDTEAVELGDERRCALETVSGDHRPMVPQRHGTCQQ